MSVELEPLEIERRCAEQLDFLAVFCMPDVTTSVYPDFYQEVWKLLIHTIATLGYGEVFRFALGLPRGHVKTTFMKLLVVYVIIFGLADFILIICATEPLAKNFLADIDDILKSDTFTDVFGSWSMALTTDTKELKRAKYRGQDIILAAAGAGTSIRGLNIKNRRPQFILFDDAQTKENAKSPTESADLLRWIIGTAIKGRDNKKAVVIYVGNLYDKDDCILAKFAKVPSWMSLITGALLADGTSLWPELRSVESLVEEFNHDADLGEGAVWFAEVQNDPIASSVGLLPDGTLPEAWEVDLSLGIAGFITIDPAGRQKKSDDNVIAPHIMMDHEHTVTPEFAAGIMNPEEVILKTIEYIIDYRISVVFVESVAYQETLVFWMERYLAEYHLENTVVVVPINPGKASKLSRIRVWIKLLLQGKWSILDSRSRNRLLFQALKFKVDKTDNRDDILDCIAQAAMAINKHLDVIINNSNRLGAIDNTVDASMYKGDTSPVNNLRRRSV